MATDKEIRDHFTQLQQIHPREVATIEGKIAEGYPTARLNIVEHTSLEYIAKMPNYKDDPITVYRQMCINAGVSMTDQWIPKNPLTMGAHGYEGGSFNATTGAKQIVVDDIIIDDPDRVVQHMEEFLFPQLEKEIADFDLERSTVAIGTNEYNQSLEAGDTMLKTGHNYVMFPKMRYAKYGYENYFSAFALYPELIEKDFVLQAQYAKLRNQAAAKAIKRYNLPKLIRLDHDMTDSRGSLVDIKKMEKMYFPYLDDCLQPMLATDTKMIWHCDGFIKPLMPYLIEIGIDGFQGFQYEHGMDFKEICAMRTKENTPLIVWAGVSVTTTLPFGTPEDVRNQMKYFVDNHGDTSLILGASSSILPGVSLANLDALIEGFAYYRTHRQ